MPGKRKKSPGLYKNTWAVQGHFMAVPTATAIGEDTEESCRGLGGCKRKKSAMDSSVSRDVKQDSICQKSYFLSVYFGKEVRPLLGRQGSPQYSPPSYLGFVLRC